jgi:hypothetical protein
MLFFVVDLLHDILDIVVRKLSGRVMEACMTESLTNDKVRHLTEELQAIPKHLEAVTSIYKVEKMLAERGMYTIPNEVVLGTREELGAVRVNSTVSVEN